VDHVLVVQFAVVVLILGTIAVGDMGLATLARLSWSASILFNVGTCLSARRIVQLLPAGDPARRFWWAYGFAALAIAAGYANALVHAGHGVVATAGTPGGSVTAAFLGTGVTTVVVVMCTYPLRISTRRGYTCFWLDMATVMVGAGVFGWYFSSRPGVPGTQLLDILTGPVAMLVAVFAVTKLLVGGRPPFSFRAGLLGIGAPASGAVVAALGPWMLGHGHGNWFYALSALGDACLMLAARVQRREVGTDPGILQRTRKRPYSTLPYLALGATFALLAVALFNRGLDARTWTVLAGVVASTGLVVVRQLASLAENARLLAELDAKVTALHETEAVLRTALHERDVLAAELHDMAFRDGLTGLANRALFQERLSTALAQVRPGLPQLVVMLIDLDDFKPVNDHYGHAAGDAVLREVGVRLRNSLRETDTAARLGGDEFGVLLESPLPDDVGTVAERLAYNLAEPYVVDGVPVRVGASVGVAHGHYGERDGDRLLSEADAAMYQAKSRSKGARL
jgi:diguanylate cyclase (GGDEF)-like protein